MIEHFKGALRGQGLTDIRCQKIQEWEARAHEHGAMDDFADLEKILKRAIVFKDIACRDIYDSGKYVGSGNCSCP